MLPCHIVPLKLYGCCCSLQCGLYESIHTPKKHRIDPFRTNPHMIECIKPMQCSWTHSLLLILYTSHRSIPYEPTHDRTHKAHTVQLIKYAYLTLTVSSRHVNQISLIYPHRIDPFRTNPHMIERIKHMQCSWSNTLVLLSLCRVVTWTRQVSCIHIASIHSVRTHTWSNA